jgi:hypothetical protein
MLQQQSLSPPYKDKDSQQHCNLCPIDEILLHLLKKIEKSNKFKKYIPRPIRENIDLLLSLTRKNKSVLKAIISSLLAKLKYPDWDTRIHKKNLGGIENLNRIDEKYISTVLFEKRYYDSSTKFSLTASLNLAEPFSMNYKGGISPKECKNSFLILMEEMNENPKFDCEKVLLYILQKLKERKEDLQKLQKKSLIIKEEITLQMFKNFINEIFNTVENCSVLPVIAIHTLHSLNKNLILKPLKEHTACDKNSDSFGDIEGYDKDTNELALVVEVKHKIKITDTIIKTFELKNKSHLDISLCIVTTEKQEQDFYENILLANVSQNIEINLYTFYNKNIKDYIISFRKAIFDYKNLDIKVKEDCEKIFQKYMK